MCIPKESYEYSKRDMRHMNIPKETCLVSCDHMNMSQETYTTSGGDGTSNNYDCQNFEQFFTGVPVAFKPTFTGVPKIQNKVSRK